MAPSDAAAELAGIRGGMTDEFRSQGAATNWDAAFAAADIMAALVGVAGIKPVTPAQVSQGAQVVKGLFDGKYKKSNISVRINPFFKSNGFFDDGDYAGDKEKRWTRGNTAPLTCAYLRSRSIKSHRHRREPRRLGRIHRHRACEHRQHCAPRKLVRHHQRTLARDQIDRPVQPANPDGGRLLRPDHARQGDKMA